MKQDRKGFTLIELLIVIGILGFLAAAILVAVDPVKRIQDARDARRSSEVASILSAVLKKQVDDRALYDGETDAPIITQAGNDAQVIVSDATNVDCDVAADRPGCDPSGFTFDITTGGTECVANLSGVVPDYLGELPLDPLGAGENPCPATETTCALYGDMNIGDTAADPSTGYYIQRSTGNRIEIGACFPEQATKIRVKR
ncbi:hypothetical protein AMJ57_03940 [Parcubacteria bacterium SG8_24]|nr:MAG: hypothetical protein AMJ57_03940 [Parcubacteria bacterium SG8_24]